MILNPLYQFKSTLEQFYMKNSNPNNPLTQNKIPNKLYNTKSDQNRKL